jgi:DinB superfamily
MENMQANDTQASLFIKMTIDAWSTQNSRLSKMATDLTDEQLLKAIAPGKNTGVYLLGHLIAVNDAMLPLLGFGEKFFPEMEGPFIKNPDKGEWEKQVVAKLKEQLQTVNGRLSQGIAATTTEGWLEKHAAVSEADFVKEPYRNKLNIIINRTNHMSYHLGQIALLKKGS